MLNLSVYLFFPIFTVFFNVLKITNLLSNDFNTIQNKAPLFFGSMVAPLGLAAIIVILITRFGWPGILIAVVILGFIPFQILIGKLNGTVVQQINVFKDQRIKVCSEIIQGIKFIKLYGWEIAFKHIIQTLRQKQIKDYMKLAFGRSLQRTLGNISSNIAGFTCFIVMDLTHEGTGLTTAKVFATMELMATLKSLVLYLGISFGFYYELKIIFSRFCTILNIKDVKMVQINTQTKQEIAKSLASTKCNPEVSSSIIDPYSVSIQQLIDPSSQTLEYNLVSKGEILMQNFNGYWKSGDLEQPTLKNLNIHIPTGHFLGFTGKIGIFGRNFVGNPVLFGKNGTIAYVEQQPIIFSATVKENIIFGNEFKQQRYDRAIELSCLDTDLQILQNGDQTVVGERGITLSGGQKARLSLARAIYFDADIYLLDDPISAVDSKVAKRIYEQTLLTMKGNKTIVLVTHQISYLYGCDQIVILEDGKIVQTGTPENLRDRLNEIEMTNKKQQQEEEEQNSGESNSLQKFQEYEMNSITIKNSTHKKIPNGKTQQQLVKVSCKSYVRYIFYQKMNYILFLICICFFLMTQAVNVLFYRFLGQYDNMKAGNSGVTFTNINYFLLAQGMLLTSYFLFSILVLNSNETIHKDMIHGSVRSPSSYFDVTPTGRLNNKFSNDLGIMDNMLSFVLTESIQGSLVSIILLINVFSINVWFLIPSLLNVVLLIIFFIYCKHPIIAVKQLDLQLKSLIFSMVGEMITGLLQIRIFKRRFNLLKQFSLKLNDTFRGNICFWNLSRAFGANVNYFSIIVIMIGWIIGVAIVTHQTAGLYAVSVVFLIEISNYLQYFLRQIISLQSMIVSVQRAFIIANLKTEKILRTDEDRKNNIQIQSYGEDQQEDRRRNLINRKNKITPAVRKYSETGELLKWPERANLRLQKFSMRYRPQLPLVLKNISFDIKEREKVGIIGRTGAGKSSIIQAIFRICEPEIGSKYEIGGLNALEMGLHSLRQNISVIPQTPFLFKGTIRKSLDPFQHKPIVELWRVLEESNLKETVEKLPQKLESDVTNISEVFSVGQKQLLCLARALLPKKNIWFSTKRLRMST